ncbi:MAG: TonB-dependent receptor [Rhodocyclaceae bacterium]
MTTLDAIVVKGEGLADTGAAGFTHTTIERDEVRSHAVDQVDDLYRQVPGMTVRDFGLPGVASSIVLRGFGNGGHGGDIGYVVDGIPLNEAMSHADGYADLNVVVPLELQSISVLKGPVSALYGNFNRAGTVTLETRKSGDYREADLSIGSFGTVDLQGALGMPLSNGDQINLAAQHYRSDGYRDQSQNERTTLTGRWQTRVGDRLELAVSARAHDANADNPSYLPEAAFRRHPYDKDPRVQNDGAQKHFFTLRGEASYRVSETLKLLSFVYATEQEFTRWFSRPVSGVWRQREEDYDRSVWGAGASLNGSAAPAAIPLRWVAGVETYRESTDFTFHDSLNHRDYTAPAISDRRSVINSISAFAQVEADVHRLFQPSLAVRWDQFDGECTRNGAETTTAACADMETVSHTSPKVSVRARPSEALELRASWAEGFALASDFIKYTLGAGDLEPNVFRQTELGARLTLASALSLDVAAYRIASSGEVAQVLPGVYENFGSTRRTGVEVSALWAPTESVEVSLAWGTAESKITRNANAAVEGNSVTGVPRYTVTLSSAWRFLPDWQVDSTWRQVGPYWVDSANTERYGGFGTLDLKLQRQFGGAHPSRIYLAIDNVGDRQYATAVSAIGYAAGAPRTLRLGAQMSF